MISRQATSRARIQLSLLLVVLLATFAAVGLSCGAPSFSEDARDKLEAALDGTMASSKAPGAITGVWTPEGTCENGVRHLIRIQLRVGATSRAASSRAAR